LLQRNFATAPRKRNRIQRRRLNVRKGDGRAIVTEERSCVVDNGRVPIGLIGMVDDSNTIHPPQGSTPEAAPDCIATGRLLRVADPGDVYRARGRL